MNGLGVLFSAWLWVTALLLPIGEFITLGEQIFMVGESLGLLGREFVFVDTDRPFLAIIFFSLLVWVIGAWLARSEHTFVPFSFVMVSLLTAALAVEPFLYAALLIEICILLSVPLLSPPGQTAGKGVFRFLTFQTLGMPFILISGWFLAGLEVSPGLTGFVLRAGVLIGIGFAFLLAVVPFHSWIPSLAEESEPYIVAFILFFLPVLVSLFGLGFIDRFVWMRETPEVYQGLKLVGVLMVLVGGVWAAVERHLGRQLGYAFISETGFSLIVVGIGSREALLLYFWFIVIRLISVVPWAAALSYIRRKNNSNLEMDSLRGFGYFFPLPVIILLVAQFSLYGLPFLGGFSARLSFWRLLSMDSPLIASAALVGTIGLFLGGIRVLNALFVLMPGKNTAANVSGRKFIVQDGVLVSEVLLEWVLLGMYLVVLVVIGLFPQVYLPWLEQLLFMFERIGQG